MSSAAILHTSDSHIERFAPMISSHGNQYNITQHVDENLLRKAEKAGGLTEEITSDCLKLLKSISSDATKAILITCSTLGTIADTYPEINGCKLLRIDQTLAEAVIKSASNIAVLYAVETTKGPTSKLFEKVRDELSAEDTKIKLHYVENAWDAFLSGNILAYNQIIADYIIRIEDDADVFALAQASMDRVPDLLPNFEKPIFSSPQLAIDALIETLNH